MIEKTKGTALIGAAIFALSMLASVGQAQALTNDPVNTAVVSVGVKSGAQGTDIIVPVSMVTSPSSNPVAFVFSMNLSYDPNVLEFKTILASNDSDLVDNCTTLESGYDTGVDAGQAPSGVLFLAVMDASDTPQGCLGANIVDNVMRIKFGIKAGAPAGEYILDVLESEVDTAVLTIDKPIPPYSGSCDVPDASCGPFNIPITSFTNGSVTVNAPPEPCSLVSADWNPLSMNEGGTVSLVVTGANCTTADQVSFIVKEYDYGSGNEDVINNPINVAFSENTATGSWTAEWQNDGLDLHGFDPEYFFTAALVSNPSVTISSSTDFDYMLHVSQSSDSLAPVVTAFTAPATSTSLNIPINSFTATDNVGVTDYMITTSAVKPGAGDSGWSGTKPGTFTVAADGSYTLYPWAKDAADNVSNVFGSPRTVVVDTTVFAVSSTVPSHGAIEIAPESEVVITWNKDVDCATATTGLIWITPTIGSGWTQSSCSNNQAVFTTVGQSNSTEYTITVSTGVRDTGNNSMPEAYSFSYTTAAQIDNDPPITTATPNTGSYPDAQSVTLSVNEAATTYFTTDRSVPTETSNRYSVPIEIPDTATLKFFSKDTAGNKEAVKTETYIIDSTIPVTTATPSGGHYSAAQTVTLNVSDEDDTTTYYTIDGSEPTVASLVYTDPINISATTTLRFFSKDAAGNTESPKTEVYNVRVYGLSDFLGLVTEWLTSGPDYDINGDNVVNSKDIGIMMSNWGN